MDIPDEKKLRQQDALQYLAGPRLLARYGRLSGPQGAAIKPFADEVLWQRVEDLTDDEHRRLCKLWKERREDPWVTVPELSRAVAIIATLTTAPKRLGKRRGRHRGRLGDDPVTIELTRQFIKRLHDLVVKGLRKTRTSKRDRSDIARSVLSEIAYSCIITNGPLKEHIVRWDERHVQMLKGIEGVVQNILRLHLRSDRARAVEIVMALLSNVEHRPEPLSFRYLERILKQTKSPRPLPDLIHPLTP